MTWVQPVAAWTDELDDLLAAAQRVVARLRARLEREGAAAVGDVEIWTTSTLDGAGTVVLAEVRAIRLRHPNPFPRMRLFRWLP